MSQRRRRARSVSLGVGNCELELELEPEREPEPQPESELVSNLDSHVRSLRSRAKPKDPRCRLAMGCGLLARSLAG